MRPSVLRFTRPVTSALAILGLVSLLGAGGPEKPADPAPKAISFEMLTATFDSLPVGGSYVVDVVLLLQHGFRSSTLNPGLTAVNAASPSGDGLFEGLRISTDDPALPALTKLQMPVRAKVRAHKVKATIGLDYLVIDALRLEAFHDENGRAFTGTVTVRTSLPMRLSTKLDGSAYAPPVVLTPSPLGIVMDDAGAVSLGVAVPNGASREVEVKVGDEWIPLELSVTQ